MKGSGIRVALILAGFAVYYLSGLYGAQELFDILNGITPGPLPAYFIMSVVRCIPLILVMFYLHRSGNVSGASGLQGNFPVAVIVSLIATIPMWLGSSLLFRFDTEVTINRIVILVVFAPFFEEVVYRGFLFGQLFRFARMGFIPSVVISAILFAAGHLYQSSDPWTLTGVFITTLMGGALFAWIFAEWSYNLWVPVLLHLMMNLSWLLFSVSDNAMGGLWPNIFRGMTIALVILGTLYYKKRKGIRLTISRPVLWRNNQT